MVCVENTLKDSSLKKLFVYCSGGGENRVDNKYDNRPKYSNTGC